MLADEIQQSKIVRSALRDGAEQAFKAISLSTKFVVDSDFSRAADAICASGADLAKVLPFCALPYRSCWFEFNQADRPIWLAAANGHPQDVITRAASNIPNETISKIGLLAEAIDDDFKSFRIGLFFKCRPVGFDADTISFSSVGIIHRHNDLSTLIDILHSRQPRRGFQADAHRVFDVQIYAEDFVRQIRAKFGDGAVQSVIEGGINDWRGESRFLLSIIALMNAKNVSEVAFIDKADLNRLRQRKRKPPLSSHYVLKIQPRAAASLRTQNQNGIEGLRAHFVRGHFKVRKTGVYFWSPFMRGDLSKGYIAKDYRVADAAGAQR